MNAGDDVILSECQGAIIELTDLLSADVDTNGFFEGDNIIFNGNSWNTSASMANQTYTIDYIVLSNDMDCPNDTAYIEIELLEQLSAGVALVPAEACEGSMIDLSEFITMQSQGGYFSTQSDPGNPITDGMWQLDNEEDFYYIIEESGACPADSLAFTIEISDSPEFNLSVLGSYLCNENSELSIDLDIEHLGIQEYNYEFTIRNTSDNSIISQSDSLSSSDMTIQLGTDSQRDGLFSDSLLISSGTGMYILEIHALMQVVYVRMNWIYLFLLKFLMRSQKL